jgi:L-ascorbate metabolism protein UlaG (beta-lactamase superfamily)
MRPMTDVRLTHIGGPTTLLEFGGWRILTDPTFDEPGRRYAFALGTSSTKLTGPAMPPAALGPIDAVLLTHDHHADNLDDAGRTVLAGARTVVTTVAGARRLGDGARGAAPWDVVRLEAPERPTVEVTATPCRHGPPLSRPVVGDVVGFSLRWEGQAHGELWFTGDTVVHRRLREVGRRCDVGTIVAHLGGVRFGLTGPLHYTMRGRDLATLRDWIRPHRMIPVHYEGWSHFHDDRASVERALLTDPTARGCITWLPIGAPRVLDV